MKTLSIIATGLLASAVALAGPGKGKKAITYKVDTKASTIDWTGKKVTGSHTGKISFESGAITTNGKALTGGTVAVAMKTMTVEDIKDAETSGKFLGHMHSPDFFDTEKHPKAIFKITGVKKTGPTTYDVTGDLTVKATTLPQTVPVTVTMAGTMLTAKGVLKIDRTKYDIKYGSGSFFSDLGDKMINDDFELNLNLVAKK